MNINIYKLIPVALIFCLGCNKTPTQIDPIELRDDFSEAEFQEAIIGKWESIYEIPGEENVEYLELSGKGDAKIIIKKNSDKNEYEGNYSLNFLRPPSRGVVTFAELTIKTSEKNIILSRVNFDLHNALPLEAGPFLRIDEAPYGVLKKII